MLAWFARVSEVADVLVGGVFRPLLEYILLLPVIKEPVEINEAKLVGEGPVGCGDGDGEVGDGEAAPP